MSKVFEVTIIKNRTADACGFHWPDWWSKIVNAVQVLAYEDHSEIQGESEERAICITSDPMWGRIQELDDPDNPRVRLISDAEANNKGREWRPQSMRIQDPHRVMEIAAKVGKGQAISEVERRALDPDDANEPGIGKGLQFDITRIKRQRGE